MLRAVDDLVTIGEFSARCGMSQKRLRAYAAAGVLVPAAVDPANGYRYYSSNQVGDALLIDALRTAGMPLVDIGRVLKHRSPAQLDDWSRQLEDDMGGRRRALYDARELLAGANDGRVTERTATMRVHSAARSETGRVRPTNEDVLIVGDRLAVVADGMGGAPGGEVASSLAVSVIEAAFAGRSRDELAAAVRAANRAIFERAGAEPALAGMGTTVCAVAVLDDAQLLVAAVGDSRALLLRDGRLVQLTQDHTVTADLVRRGELDAADANEHPHRGVLTRVLGAGPDVDVDVHLSDARVGDRVLVCTDGLWIEVDDDTIAELLTSLDRQSAIDALVDRAVDNGGRDNVTAVILDISDAR